MDEASLDDFFAKKDKSKKKSKSSKITPDDILSKGDELSKKEKKKKEKEKSQSSTNVTKQIDGTPNNPEEEEWKEVEEEKEKDYSGLRIANLQIGEKEGEESDDQTAENPDEDHEDGDGREKKDGQQGPWKGTPATPQQSVIQTEPEPQEAPKPKEESKPSGKYIPPSQRAAAAAAASGVAPSPTVPAHLRKKKAAPNIKSEEDFPTLGGGGPGPAQHDSDPRSFERVQHGGRQLDDPTKTSQQLSLGNKFSALQD